jgi:dihydroxyacetone kinase-like predicted kinase
MAIFHSTGKRFKQIILAGADWVVKNRDYLNKMNVFPVPDGDTGVICYGGQPYAQYLISVE